MDSQTTQKLVDFFSTHTQQMFAKQTIIIRAGESPKGIFYLQKGHVRQYVITQFGEEMTLNIYKPGAFFPMSQAVNEYPNLYYFEAMDEVLVWVAPKDETVAFIKKDPDIMYDLVKRVFRGLEGLLSRMEYLMSGDARTRLITVLIISGKRFGELEENRTAIHLKLTHQDLASLTGLSRETVSREMMLLRKQNLISYSSSNINILDESGLEKILTD